SPTNNTGILLLCEVALGDQYELTHADYYADQHSKDNGKHSTKGLGLQEPDAAQKEKLEHMTVPLGKLKKNPKPNGYLQYNEFIVYDTKQIRI
ncbi:Poly [ADP-ribose] polymerase 2, partial [Gonapodya sp. JEL0774]